jgi:inner membrane protein
MDNVTHTLVGLTLSRAGLNRMYARPALLLVLAANVPDIDFVAFTRGQLAYFEAHRGWTHAIVMMPLMALLPVLVTCAIGRSMRGWRAAYVLSLIGVASHLLLDWTNTYGVRFLLPFSKEWFRLDLNDLIDLWIWAALLIAVIAPWIARLVSTEIGAKPGSGRGLAWFALLFFVAYDFGRYLIHQRAVEILNAHVYQEGPPIRVAAFPASSGNPFIWTGWIERPAFDMRFQMNLRSDFDPLSGRIIYKPDSSPVLDAARQTYPVQRFLEFAAFPAWRVTPVPDPEGAQRVEVRDWRFPFTAGAVIDRTNRVVSTFFHY